MGMLDLVRREGYLVRREIGRGETPTMAVVEAVQSLGIDCTMTGGDLYDIVEPDALDRLFETKYDGTSRADGAVLFEAWGVTLLVTTDAVEVYSDSVVDEASD